MFRRLFSLAAVAILSVAACSGGASPAPATAVPTPVSTATPAAIATPTALASPDATLDAVETVSLPIADVAGSDEFLVEIPGEWITLTARDIASEAALAAWQAAHPEVSADSARTVADGMSTDRVSLFAFDAAHQVDGFTPNLNVTWIDSPVRDFEPWIADQAASVSREYKLDKPLEYQAWTPSGEGLIGGFIGSYRYSMQGVALAGSQMIVPQPDGRAAVLTFTCRDSQTDLYSPVVEALFTSLSAKA